jgi:DNA invertase Pin-like site-specific DNA recombinase
VVSKLDWLARSILHLTQITHDLEQRNINLVVIDQAIDTTMATGTLLFNMLASNVELETAIRAERQAKGIVKVQANGCSLVLSQSPVRNRCERCAQRVC